MTHSTRPDPAAKPGPRTGPTGHHAEGDAARPSQPPITRSSGRARLLATARTGVLALAVVGAVVVATLGTIGSWPALTQASEPTAMDKLADLQRLGLGADGLLAAGLTVNQASGVLDWIADDRTRFNAIRAAHSELRGLETSLANVRSEMVRVGRTETLDTDYAALQAQANSAQAAYDTLITQARSALGTLVSEDLEAGGVWPVVQRVIDHSGYEVPTAFKVLQLTEEEWEQVEHYHAMIEKRPEAIEPSTAAFVDSLRLSSAVANAQARIDSDAPALLQAVLGG